MIFCLIVVFLDDVVMMLCSTFNIRSATQTAHFTYTFSFMCRIKQLMYEKYTLFPCCHNVVISVFVTHVQSLRLITCGSVGLFDSQLFGGEARFRDGGGGRQSARAETPQKQSETQHDHLRGETEEE